MSENYRCMCRNGHEPIGYTRDDESCPLCDALAALDARRASPGCARVGGRRAKG